MRNGTFPHPLQSRPAGGSVGDESNSIALHISRESLREIIAEVIRCMRPSNFPEGRLALTEAEAAAACGVAGHVLRDLRLTGQIQGRKLGRRIVYTQADVLAVLDALARSSGQ